MFTNAAFFPDTSYLILSTTTICPSKKTPSSSSSTSTSLSDHHHQPHQSRPVMAQSPYLSQAVTKVDVDEGHNARFSYAAANCQGWRNTQEDTHIAKLNLDSTTSLFAVFDGHNGPEVALFLAQNFAEYLEKCGPYRRGHIQRGLQETFMELDSALLKSKCNSEKLLKYHRMCTVNHPVVAESVALLTGSTGVVLLVKNDIYYVANVGDSRCLLARDGRAIQLSVDHKPTVPEERARIEKAGGKVMDGRVNGVIDVSRAFGDHHLKARTNEKTGAELSEKETLVVAWPHLTVEPANAKKDAFLVLMCDGIWNAMDNQAVVAFVQRGLDAKWPLAKIARRMIDKIRPEKMPPTGIVGKDNMTVVIIKPESTGSSKSLHTPESVKSKDSSSLKAKGAAKSAVSTTESKGALKGSSSGGAGGGGTSRKSPSGTNKGGGGGGSGKSKSIKSNDTGGKK